MSNDAIVLGAGAAGLSAAHFMQKAGFNIKVFEALSRPGGRIQTFREKGFTVEQGPLGWIDGDEALEEVCSDLGLAIIRSQAADTHRYIESQGKLLPLPQGPTAFAKSNLLTLKEKFRFLAEPMADLPEENLEETVSEFIARRFGQGFEFKIARPIVAGLFGADARELSMAAMFPGIIAAELHNGSLTKSYREWAKKSAVPICTVPGGLNTLVNKLVATHSNNFHDQMQIDTALFEEGWWYVFNEGNQIARARRLVVALPPRQMALVLRNYLEDIRKEIESLEGPDLVSVSLAYPRNNVSDACAGFGLMAECSHNRPLLSVQFLHSIFPDFCPEGQVLLRCLLGGAFATNFGKQSDLECLESAVKEIDAILGLKGSPSAYWVTKHRGGVPPYKLGHTALVEKLLKKIGSYSNIQIAGDAFFGAGINAAFQRGKNIAKLFSTSKQ